MLSASSIAQLSTVNMEASLGRYFLCVILEYCSTSSSLAILEAICLNVGGVKVSFLDFWRVSLNRLRGESSF